MAQVLELEQDGLVENLYHFLWSKDKLFKVGPNILVPDTIIYQYESPAFWYFYSFKECQVLRKNKIKLNNEQIQKQFLRHQSQSGIIAVYIYNKTEKNIVNVMNEELKEKLHPKKDFDIEENEEETFKNYRSLSIHEKKPATIQKDYLFPWEEEQAKDKEKKDRKDVKTYIEYLDKEGFQILRITWSPKICLFERKQNVKDINDKRYDLYERAVTYEGEEYHSKNYPLRGANIPQRLQTIGNSISQHIRNITFERIRPNRMILNLKLDKNDQLWFLWCSSLRSEGKIKIKKQMKFEFVTSAQTINAKPLKVENKINVPDKIRLGQSHSVKAPQNLQRTSKCLSCNFCMEGERMHEITMNMIIKDHELRAFKDFKYMVKKEVRNPKDLLDRQQMLIKGIDIKPPQEIGFLTQAQKQEQQQKKEIMEEDYSQVKSKIEMGNSLTNSPRKGQKLDETEDKWYNQVSIDKDEQKIKVLQIPFIIKQLYSELDLAHYEKLKQDLKFLNQTTFVCEECYLCISMSSEASGNKIKVPRLSKPHISKYKNPEKILKRRNITLFNIQKKEPEEEPFKLRNYSQGKKKFTPQRSVQQTEIQDENWNEKSVSSRDNDENIFNEQANERNRPSDLYGTDVTMPYLLKELRIYDNSQKEQNQQYQEEVSQKENQDLYKFRQIKKPPRPKNLNSGFYQMDIDRKKKDLEIRRKKIQQELSMTQIQANISSLNSTNVHTPQYRDRNLKDLYKVYTPGKIRARSISSVKEESQPL